MWLFDVELDRIQRMLVCWTRSHFAAVIRISPIDSVGGYMLVSKAKPCMSKYK